MKNFLILGCQRSGTTLLRLILDSHKQIHCFDETKSYYLLSNSNLLNKEIKKYSNLEYIGFKIPSLSEQLNEKILIDQVNDLKIENRFSQYKLIFIYRNVFDVISSMKNYVQKNGKSWLDNWSIKSINQWEKSKNFTQKYAHELDLIEKSNNKLVASAALYWKTKNQFMLDYELQKKSIIKISYEELCMNPKNSIFPLIQFLNLDWDDNLLNHENISHDEVNPSGITVGMNIATIPIVKSHIGKSQTDLTQNEKEDISFITSDLMKFLYQ